MTAASTAPAKCRGYPRRIIAGIVSEPTVTALATEEPDNMPNIADANTLTFAGPPA
jgi:hypothetical protein